MTPWIGAARERRSCADVLEVHGAIVGEQRSDCGSVTVTWTRTSRLRSGLPASTCGDQAGAAAGGPPTPERRFGLPVNERVTRRPPGETGIRGCQSAPPATSRPQHTAACRGGGRRRCGTQPLAIGAAGQPQPRSRPRRSRAAGQEPGTRLDCPAGPHAIRSRPLCRMSDPTRGLGGRVPQQSSHDAPTTWGRRDGGRWTPPAIAPTGSRRHAA